MYAVWVCQLTCTPLEDRIPRAGMWATWCGCWDPSLSPLEEQEAPITARPSLQPLHLSFPVHFSFGHTVDVHDLYLTCHVLPCLSCHVFPCNWCVTCFYVLYPHCSFPYTPSMSVCQKSPHSCCESMFILWSLKKRGEILSKEKT